MAMGVCCGDGWYDLIHKLCKGIMAVEPSEDFKAEQIKEKFGGLRFYTSGAFRDMSVHDLINKAESESFKTCEACGSKEDVTCDGRPNWVTTLCGKCAAPK